MMNTNIEKSQYIVGDRWYLATNCNSTANIMVFPWYPLTFIHMFSTHKLNEQNVNDIQILWPLPYSVTSFNVDFTSPPMKAPLALKLLHNPFKP